MEGEEEEENTHLETNEILRQLLRALHSNLNMNNKVAKSNMIIEFISLNLNIKIP